MDSEDLERFVVHASKCNNLLKGLHEACGPFISSRDRQVYGIEDDYGGITGTILPSHIQRFARLLMTGEDDSGKQVLPARFRLKTGESVFCDIGSGTGRPSFYFGALSIKCSIGFDVDTLQVMNSCAGHHRLLSGGIKFACPVTFFKANADLLPDLAPVTHVYSFIGYSEFARTIGRLIADTPSIQVFAAVTLRLSELIEAGFLSSSDDEDIVKFPSMQMAGGKAYLGVVIPITAKRRRLLKLAAIRSPGQIDQVGIVEEKVNEAIIKGPHTPMTLLEEVPGRPRRACAKLYTESENRSNIQAISPAKRARTTSDRNARSQLNRENTD